MSPNCPCQGAKHLVCLPKESWKGVAYLKPAWRELAPWLADYDAVPRRAKWGDAQHTERNRPNLLARRTAAQQLGVTCALPKLSENGCPCVGRDHLVCLSPREWGAVVRPVYAWERRYCHHGDGVGYGPRERREHTPACRVLRASQRWDAERPGTQRRLLRLWLAVLRQAWAPRPKAASRRRKRAA